MRWVGWGMALVGISVGLHGGSGRPDAAEVARGEVYAVTELTFRGPTVGPSDAPARDVEFGVRFRHESGEPELRVHGFWDGDGRGGARGDVFRVRFCPTRPGRWTLVEVASNRRELRDQREGEWVTVRASRRKGFWIPDAESPGARWYRRSDGSHPYIFGNTMYSFLSERDDRGPHGSDIARDVRANAEYFNKLRFSVHPDRYVHPTDKPFLDATGQPTDDGRHSHRPNPCWFSRRVDLAVRTGFELDTIADLILNGPDTREARSILRAGENGGDSIPFLRYVAARYGSYPNVWFCLSNEWDIKEPRFTAAEAVQIGHSLRGFLPYPTPVSIHGQSDWTEALNAAPGWSDHVILQHKLKDLGAAADSIGRNHRIGGGNRPVINDELAYEGEGDKFSGEDVVESHLGAFLGGGYASTGFKPANKKGHYFWGHFKAEEHRAAPPLKWLREQIDRDIPFWMMQPAPLKASLFRNTAASFRALSWNDRAYLLGTDETRTGVVGQLPPGEWEVTRYDVLNRERKQLAGSARGAFTFDAPASRAVLFYFKRK